MNDPAEYSWWLASRASGVVALMCVTISVGAGLAMAGRVSRRPGGLLALHQQTALVGLVAIAVHGITLLGDAFLNPSVGDVTIPFTSKHEPLWTGLGVTGGWLAAILGLSFWVRNLVGPGLWRKLHRATTLVYVLAVAHTLGAGTDAAEPWMRALIVGTGAPVLFLFAMRLSTPATAPKFRRFRVRDVRPESATVLSLDLEPIDRKPAPRWQPGQFVTVRADVPGHGTASRSYSLSCAPGARHLRISVKREPGGRMSEHLHTRVETGDVLELSAPAGGFVLGEPGERPLVLVSAGIGVTPVLAMLGAAPAEREVWWIHGARNGAEHAFRGEARAHLQRHPRAHSHVRYSQPRPRDEAAHDFDAAGRLDATDLIALGVPTDAEYRLCGPTAFVTALVEGLVDHGVHRARILSESFGGTKAPAVSFSRSSVATSWKSEDRNLLEVAEANSVAVASGCRVGSCHGCTATVLAGRVRHDPEPASAPAGRQRAAVLRDTRGRRRPRRLSPRASRRTRGFVAAIRGPLAQHTPSAVLARDAARVSRGGRARSARRRASAHPPQHRSAARRGCDGPARPPAGRAAARHRAAALAGVRRCCGAVAFLRLHFCAASATAHQEGRSLGGATAGV